LKKGFRKRGKNETEYEKKETGIVSETINHRVEVKWKVLIFIDWPMGRVGWRFRNGQSAKLLIKIKGEKVSPHFEFNSLADDGALSLSS
jgi:hypothetical protein